MKTHGFVYQHFDSRGGTTFVVADTRAEADQIYRSAFATGDPEWDSDLGGVCDEDFAGEADVESAEPLPEDDLDCFYNQSGLGAVGGEIPNLFYDPTVTPEQAGDEELWPRWGDDAFGFVVMKEAV